MRQLFRELKRRNVYRVAVTYAAVAFVTLQAAKLVFPATTLEGLYDKLVVLAFVGFPIALVLAWAFELTPEGVRRTRADGAETLSTGEKSRLAVTALVGLGLVSGAVVGGWYLAGGGGEAPDTGAPAADSARAEDRSIAVLPFENMGGEESEQFTQGVHDGLLTRLSNISDLKVISRTSVMQYEDTDETVPQIARELGARWVVEGAVQQADGRVQVNAQLIQAREDAHRWARTYRRELSPENLFDIQSELTRKIARSLEAELSPEERERVERAPTGDLDAYQLYVQGRRSLVRRVHWDSPEPALQEAVRLFRRAIERDSSFALAWAGLADAAGHYPSEVADSVIAPAVDQEAAARRALELGPELAEAHASMGFLHLNQMDGPAALRELRRALELKPSYWEAHRWLGSLYLMIGRPRQAIEHLELALDLNPRHAYARWRLYDAYLAVGRAKESLEAARRQRERLGTQITGEVRALYHLGRLGEARRLARENGWHNNLVLIEAAAGDTASAREHFEQVRADLPPVWKGLLHNALGDTGRAFEIWGRMESGEWGDIWTPGHLRYGIMLDLSRLRAEPRYRELIREANRAWGLNPDGSLPDSVDVSFEDQADE